MVEAYRSGSAVGRFDELYRSTWAIGGTGAAASAAFAAVTVAGNRMVLVIAAGRTFVAFITLEAT